VRSEFLLVVAVIALLWAVLHWRRHYSARARRHQLEDALKHLFEQEYRSRRGSISSLAGTLNLPAGAVVGLVSRMTSQGLVQTQGQDLTLTPDGERLALQIVRAHRLLERYFADEARLPLRKIHAVAERREHALSPAEVDRLSASLGHPSVDPHGDPIPARDGRVPPATGTPATAWPADTTGRVVHIEDEPEISFAQIVAAGIRVGQLLRIVDSTASRLVLSDGENEFTLAPAVAANVFLAAAPDAALDASVIRLSELPGDRGAEIVGLDEACQGFGRRRLMDLGFTEGAKVKPFLKTFAGDPRAYQVRGTLIALRRDQASQVLVRPVDGTAAPGGPPAPGGATATSGPAPGPEAGS
jgi:DtxR family Mn-dependent transcriptional regulator